VTFGDSTQLGAKVVALRTIVDQVDLTDVTGIDLQVPGRPVLTGSPQPTSVSSTGRG